MKRFIAFLTAASLALSAVTAIAAEGASSQETNNIPEASAVLDSKAQTKNMSVKVGSDHHYPYEVVERDGKAGWLIKPQRNINPAVYVDLNKSFAYNNADNSSYEVEVEYFDEGNGQFRIKYDAVTDPWKDMTDTSKYKIDKTEIVKLTDSGEWKSHKFILEHPLFKNNLESSDFCVTLHEEAMGISLGNVVFGSIKVRKLDTKSTVRAHMSTSEIGNNFFEGDKVKINLDLYNTSKEKKNVTVDLYSYNYGGEENYTQTIEAEVGAKSSVRKIIEFDAKDYSVNTMYAYVKGDGIYSSTKMEYAYSVLSEKKNPRLGVNNHMYRIMTRNPEKIVPLMAKAGFSYNREGIWWNYYETQKGVYTLPNRADLTHSLMQEYGIKEMLIFQDGGGDKLYGGNGWAVGDVLEEAFVNYCVAQVNEFKDEIHCYEILNEVSAHAADGHDAHWYARLTKKVYTAIKEIDPTITIVIGATAGTPLDWIETVCTEAKGYFDVFSIHPYGMTTSPEDSERYSAILSVRNVMDKCGAEDIPIWMSEMGWSTGWVDYEHQAAYLAQIFAISTSPELKCEHTQFYDFQDDGYMPEDQENNFGLIRTWDTVDTPYLAKPSYLAMSRLNELLTGAEYIDRKLNDNASIYRYKLDDGREAVMMWTRKDNYYMSFDINDDNAKVYDLYGNEIDVYRKGGKYALSLDYKPVYVVGNFTEFESETDPIYALSETEFDMPYGDIAEITITKNTDDNASVEVIMPDSGTLETVENNGFDGNKAVIKFKSTGKVGKSDKMYVVVTGEDGIKYVDALVNVNFTETMTIDFRTELFGDGNLNRWVGVLDVKNNNHTDTIKGRINFSSPSEMAQKIKYAEIKKTAPGETTTTIFNMPEVTYGSSYFVEGDAVLDNGFVQNVSLYADCCVAAYADTKPVIDAVMSPGEWSGGKSLKLGEGNEFELTAGAYDGNSDLSATVIYKWDEQNLYMYADVTDDIMYQMDLGSGIWQGDSIQIGLSYGGMSNPKQTSFTEIGLALSPNGPVIQRYSNETGANGATKEAKLATRREGTHTYYELMMPWSELIVDNTVLKANDAVRFNMIVNDNDKSGRWGWVEYGAGIGEYKDGTLFGYLRLMGSKNQTDEEETQ